MEDTDLGVEEEQRDKEIRLEDFRRIVTEAYAAGYREGFGDGMAFMQPPIGSMQ